MLRALFYEFPSDPICWDIKDSYLFGSDLLVAPICHEHAVDRQVYLPAGASWTDARTGIVYEAVSGSCGWPPMDTPPRVPARRQTGLPDRRDLIPPPPLRKEFSTNGYQKRPFPEPSGKNAQTPLADHSIRAFQELSSSTRDLMSCYRCAILEIETKFRVLNETLFPPARPQPHRQHPEPLKVSRQHSGQNASKKSCPLPSRQLKTTSSTSQASVSSAPLWTIFTCSPTACCSRTISR